MRARAKDGVAALQRQTASRGLVVGKEGATDWQNATELALGVSLLVVVGLAGLTAFFWSLRSGQHDDLDGVAVRILIDDEKCDEDD